MPIIFERKHDFILLQHILNKNSHMYVIIGITFRSRDFAWWSENRTVSFRVNLKLLYQKIYRIYVMLDKKYIT